MYTITTFVPWGHNIHRLSQQRLCSLLHLAPTTRGMSGWLTTSRHLTTSMRPTTRGMSGWQTTPGAFFAEAIQQPERHIHEHQALMEAMRNSNGQQHHVSRHAQSGLGLGLESGPPDIAAQHVSL